MLPQMPTFITFDCYGTLIDWERGILACFEQILRGKRADVDLRTFHRYWEEVQFQLIQEEFKPYRQILRESLAETLAAFGLPYVADDGEAFAAAMPTWEPFPEVKASLALLKGRFPLIIISNTEDGILAESIRRIGLPFDQTITAEEARVYKPNRKIFEYALAKLGAHPEEVLHVAYGFKYDIIPAKALGLMTVWVNRTGEQNPEPVEADAVIRDLRGLPGLVIGVAA